MLSPLNVEFQAKRTIQIAFVPPANSKLLCSILFKRDLRFRASAELSEAHHNKIAHCCYPTLFFFEVLISASAVIGVSLCLAEGRVEETTVSKGLRTYNPIGTGALWRQFAVKFKNKQITSSPPGDKRLKGRQFKSGNQLSVGASWP